MRVSRCGPCRSVPALRPMVRAAVHRFPKKLRTRLHRLAAIRQYSMKDMPDVDHLRPYLQPYRHVCDARGTRELQRIVQKHLRSTHLDKKRSYSAEVRVERRRQGGARICSVQISLREIDDHLAFDHRVSVRTRYERLA